MTRRLVAVLAVLATASACGSTVQLSSTQSLGAGGGSAPGASSAVAPGSPGGVAGGSAGQVPGAGTAGTGAAVGGTGPRAVAPVVPGGGGGPAVTAGGIPPTGPGWDQHSVYIGVTTQKDVNTAAETAGVKGLDGGDQEGEANAVISYLNAHGGLFGRTVKAAFHDEATVTTQQNPAQAGAEACAYYTQDRPVIAVLSPVTLMDVDSFRACLAQHHVPLFSASVAAVSQHAAAALAPYFYMGVAPTWDALAPVLVRSLTASGYFGGWNARTGTAAPGTATIGVVTPDNPEGVQVANLVVSALRAAGQTRTSVYRYDPQNNSTMNAAVLDFSSNGVDHVIATDSALLAFQLSASSQGYRPRYGITSINAPITFLQANGPPGQNTGDVGVGWSPSLDVDDAHDPDPTDPGEAQCLALMKAGGQSFSGKRLAEAVAFAFCDGLQLLVQSAVAGRGLDGRSLYAGMLKVGPSFPTAFSFASGLGPGRLFVPGGVRPLAWSSACSCFAYTSRTTLHL